MSDPTSETLKDGAGDLHDTIASSNDDFVEGIRILMTSNRYMDIMIIVFICILFYSLYNIYIKQTTNSFLFNPHLGFYMLLLVLAYSIRNSYDRISQDLNTACNDGKISSLTSIIPSSRLSVVFSFLYYYVFTMLSFVVRAIVVLLVMYICYMVLKAILYGEHVVFRPANWIVIVIAVIYSIFALLAIIAIIRHDIKPFFVPTKFGDYDPTKSKITLVNLLFIVILLVIPFNLFAKWWTSFLAKGIRRVNWVDAISHTKYFEAFNILDKKKYAPHLTVIVQGFLLALVFAFTMVPSFPIADYCNKQTDKILIQKYIVFSNKFQVAYYIVMTIVLFLYIQSFDVKKEEIPMYTVLFIILLHLGCFIPVALEKK